MSNIYLDNGYLNQKYIEDIADKHRISFIVLLGSRQIGKTYGTLKLCLDENKKFILMRRTTTEAEFICNEVNNPFTAYEDYNITIKPDSKYTAAITKLQPESDPEYIGAVMALSTIAKIRGFNGSMYTDIVFDEFIPELHVMKIKNEGDAFLNAYTTIAGAREENGRPPLRCWLLANSNDIDNPILQALNISNKVEDMMLRGQELSIMSDRGILILLPESEEIITKRRGNALFRAIGTDNKFSRMALDNKFSYNDSSDVVRVHLPDYKLIMTIGNIGIYKHKSKQSIYCSNYISGTVNESRSFSDSEKDRLYIRSHFPLLRSYLVSGFMYFSDLTTKARIFDIIFK